MTRQSSSSLLRRPSVYPLLEQRAANRARRAQQLLDRAAAEKTRAERQAYLQRESGTARWRHAGEWFTKLLGQLPFWCGDSLLHLSEPNSYWANACCTQHMFGLPRHRLTGKPSPPVPHQLTFAEDVITRRARAPSEPIFHHLNKGRQMGYTEIAVRILAHQAFGPYAGRNVGIMAATNGKLAQKNLRRLYRLFEHVPQVIASPLKSGVFELINGTRFEAFPASEEAMTGDTQYAAVLMDESAKWRIIDDRPVFNSVEPIIRSSGADLLLVSTPKGPMKTFYKIHKEPRGYIKHFSTIWDAEGTMYTREQIKHMLATSQADIQQEYLGQFTIGEDSVFGSILDEERAEPDEFQEWDGGGGHDNGTENDTENDLYRPDRPLPEDGEWPI